MTKPAWGKWTEAQIVNALRNGRAPDRLLNLWCMPWFYLHYLTEDDATAIARYLKDLRPVHNRIPSSTSLRPCRNDRVEADSAASRR